MIRLVLFILDLIIANYSFCQNNINKLLLTDFGQGKVRFSEKADMRKCKGDHKVGNCASIALIKASLAEFGDLKSIFQSFDHNTDNSVSLVMWDGFKMTIYSADTMTTSKFSGIKIFPNNKYYDTANFLYAVLSKRILLDKRLVEKIYGRDKAKTWCIKNLVDAVQYLNTGFYTSNVYELLGLKKIKIRNLRTINQYKSAIVWCSKHAAYSSWGVHDLFGTSTIAITNGKMRNAKGWDAIESGAYKLSRR